jgi:signal transduction histidine kinase
VVTRQRGIASAPGQARIVLWSGFGGLLLLMFLLGSSAVSFLYQIEIRQQQIRQEYVSRDRTLEELRSSIYLSGTFVRDFLLDRSSPPSPEHETQFRRMRRQIEAGLQQFAKQLPGSEPGIDETRNAVDGYLAETSAVFAWTQDERARRSYEFVQNELLPKRIQVLGLVDNLRTLSERRLELSSQAVSGLLSSYRLWLIVLSILALILGIGLAAITFRRTLHLEIEAGARLDQATHAREELARLSADLVAAQENERKNISRELHDEVGQTLYAAVLSLGNARSSFAANQTGEGLRELQLVNELTERTASVVRNMALLLRPPMLDDLGLLPALKWLAREATRMRPVPVDISAEDMPEELPEDHVTCVYRIVQESIHNAERHSHALAIRVELRNTAAGLTVRITDDGRGFEVSRESGLGLLGMKERAVRLGGSVVIESAPGRGTTVLLHLPGPYLPQPTSPRLRDEAFSNRIED